MSSAQRRWSPAAAISCAGGGRSRAWRPIRDHRPAPAGVFLARRARRLLSPAPSLEPDPAALRRELGHCLFPGAAGAAARALARAALARDRARAAPLSLGGGGGGGAAGAARRAS